MTDIDTQDDRNHRREATEKKDKERQLSQGLMELLEGLPIEEGESLASALVRTEPAWMKRQGEILSG